jgi:hypothetical protein
VALLALLVVVVAGYSAVFHVLMDREGQRHSWATSVYWTVVTMSTLGFGDITSESDAGRPLNESGIRQRTGLTVAGHWQKGRLGVARPTSVLAPTWILVLAGSREQLDTYDELFGRDRAVSAAPVIPTPPPAPTRCGTS